MSYLLYVGNRGEVAQFVLYIEGNKRGGLLWYYYIYRTKHEWYSGATKYIEMDKTRVIAARTSSPLGVLTGVTLLGKRASYSLLN
ncbi:hypothetical protein [Bacillus cereus group sp. MG6]|uniref:hypothetical protein n=1 Tax=Bacillus cereus group sp. MG6 TaxID=3040246 RepID=UPI0033964486